MEHYAGVDMELRRYREEAEKISGICEINECGSQCKTCGDCPKICLKYTDVHGTDLEGGTDGND
jgi:hypothetical protein